MDIHYFNIFEFFKLLKPNHYALDKINLFLYDPYI